MRKWLLIGVVFGVVAIALGIHYARPLLAARELKQALQTRSPDAVKPMVDFPTLKANVKAAKKAQVKQANDGKILEGVRNWIGDEVVDDKIDEIATPAGLIRLACDGKADNDLAATQGKPCTLNGNLEAYHYLDDGKHYRITVRKDDGKGLGLVMGQEADGHWRLVNLVDVPPKPAAAS